MQKGHGGHYYVDPLVFRFVVLAVVLYVEAVSTPKYRVSGYMPGI